MYISYSLKEARYLVFRNLIRKLSNVDSPFTFGYVMLKIRFIHWIRVVGAGRFGILSQLSYLLASYAYSSFSSPFGEIYIVIGSHILVCFLTKSLPCILFVVWKVPYPNVVPLERETERDCLQNL